MPTKPDDTTDPQQPEGYWERPNWPREKPLGTRSTPDPAHDMAALEQVDALKVRRDPDFARKITAADEGRRSISRRLQEWWMQR